MKSAIVHQYFKKQLEGFIILVQLDPIHFEGVELMVSPTGDIRKTTRVYDELIYEDLKEDGFIESGALEFNLYLKGLNR